VDHEAAVPLLSEWARRRLAPEPAAAVGEHLRVCPECRDAAAMFRDVAAVASHKDSPLFAPHPTADELASLFLARGALDPDRRAAVAAHVRVCPTCGLEARTAGRAGRAAWWQGIAALLDPQAALRRSSPVPALARALVPAFAAIALILIYPAYLGIVEYPRARRVGEQAAADFKRSRDREAELRRTLSEPAQPPAPSDRAPWGGGMRALILSGTSRTPTDDRPEIALTPEQPWLPVLIDFDLPQAHANLAKLVVMTVERDADGATVWRQQGAARTIWDSANQVVSVAVPASVFAPGNYTLAITDPGKQRPLYVSRFRIRAAPEHP